MSTIADINRVLNLISDNSPKQNIQKFRLSRPLKVVNWISNRSKIPFFFLRKCCILLESHNSDPYESLYENYWQLVFEQR